jgi:hypothetical protein
MLRFCDAGSQKTTRTKPPFAIHSMILVKRKVYQLLRIYSSYLRHPLAAGFCRSRLTQSVKTASRKGAKTPSKYDGMAFVDRFNPWNAVTFL